ncbi:hypothetical protein PMI11_06610 [Rhizobium sp. CF142]|nr:hypothetical protein PMI11_06610 [Rhizobium sp. CF142]
MADVIYTPAAVSTLPDELFQKPSHPRLSDAKLRV